MNSTALSLQWQYQHPIDQPENYNIYFSIGRHWNTISQPFSAELNIKEITELMPDTNYTLGLKICNKLANCTKEKFLQVQTPCESNCHFEFSCLKIIIIFLNFNLVVIGS